MATIRDVAQSAGVSTTTVSRYLNKRIELPAATAVRIDAAIARHDYRPNVLARRLSTGKTDAIGLVVPEIREPFFAELASAVEDEADRHGYTIFISSTRSARAREVVSLERLRDHHVDGLILLTNTPDDGTLAKLLQKRRNIVLLDEDVPGANVPKVFVENTAGAHRATVHLIEAGHRRIAYLGGPYGLFSSEERFAGYAQAMTESGIALAEGDIHRGSFAPEFAFDATQQLLAQRSPPTAIFASSDYLALGALRAMRQAGISIPGQMSFVGFDDTLIGDLLTPALTAIRQPIAALGRHGFQALLALMNRQRAPKLTRLPVELVERESVTSPPKRRGRSK
jgi:LacI family transcriptional regulator